MPSLAQQANGTTRDTKSVISTSGSTSTVSGTIYAGTASEMNVNAGSGCGYVNVYTNSSTSWTYNGDTVSSGTPITFTGTGNCGTSFTASSVTLGSSSSANLTGTIYGVSGYTIGVNGGSGCGNVNVTYTSSTSITYNGDSIAAGTPIQVWGSGNCGTSFSATKIVLGSSTSSSTIAQTHVLTSDYLGGYGGSTTIAWSTAATVLSWAEVSTEYASAISAAGIKTMDYLAPFFQESTDPLYTSNSATFSVNCSAARIGLSYNGGTLWLMNPTSTALEGLVNTWEAGQEAQGHIDAFFYDDIDTLYGVPSMPCNTTQSSWDSEGSSFIQTSTYPVIFNGYSSNTDTQSLIKTSKISGGMSENCYATTGSPTPPFITGSTWVTNENLELLAAADNKLFFCYNNGAQTGSSEIQLRNYIYASFLLTYNLSTSVLWDTFTTPSDVHVFPETKIVATSPLVSAPSSVT
ncbi:MAG TPA: hypothetical protein VMD07_00440, partial [Candidatus Acidoferrales bacterium]|nr:hypothetical protein [Candidatus Acidoferrales bacterium]